MYRPVEVMAPAVALQVTAVLLVPVMVTVNCWVAPGVSEAALGETVPVTAVCDEEVDEADAGLVAPVVPQPSNTLSASEPIMASAICFTVSPLFPNFCSLRRTRTQRAWRTVRLLR